MTREFIWTTRFDNNWKKCGFSDDDLLLLEDALLDDPELGDLMPRAGGARKVRFAYEGRGKSGAARVVYVDFEIGEKICGLDVYLKSDKEDVDHGEENNLKKEVKALAKHYNRKA